jgi:hypothetical protein
MVRISVKLDFPWSKMMGQENGQLRYEQIQEDKVGGLHHGG